MNIELLKFEILIEATENIDKPMVDSVYICLENEPFGVEI
jgi:hypothetical protein